MVTTLKNLQPRCKIESSPNFPFPSLPELPLRPLQTQRQIIGAPRDNPVFLRGNRMNSSLKNLTPRSRTPEGFRCGRFGGWGSREGQLKVLAANYGKAPGMRQRQSTRILGRAIGARPGCSRAGSCARHLFPLACLPAQILTPGTMNLFRRHPPEVAVRFPPHWIGQPRTSACLVPGRLV